MTVFACEGEERAAISANLCVRFFWGEEGGGGVSVCVGGDVTASHQVVLVRREDSAPGA